MIEQNRPSRRETACYGSREKRFAGSRVSLRFQCTENRFSGNPCSILFCITFIKGFACIARKDNYSIPEVYSLPGVSVIESPGVQNLKEKLYRIDMCFLYLVKEQDTFRILLNKFCQQPSCRSGIAFFKADKSHIGLVVCIGRHIKSLERKPQ